MKNEKRFSGGFAFNICVVYILPCVKIEKEIAHFCNVRWGGSSVRPRHGVYNFPIFRHQFSSTGFVSFNIAGIRTKTPRRFAFYLQVVSTTCSNVMLASLSKVQWMLLCFNICCYFSLTSRQARDFLLVQHFTSTTVSNFVILHVCFRGLCLNYFQNAFHIISGLRLDFFNRYFQMRIVRRLE